MIIEITKMVDVSTLNEIELLDLPIDVLVGEIMELRTTKVSAVNDKREVSVEKAVKSLRSDSSVSANLGHKNGKSSKYHYVYMITRTGEFRTTFNGETLDTFDSEIEAALAVDAFLDEAGDYKRPRNRSLFPEVHERYQETK